MNRCLWLGALHVALLAGTCPAAEFSGNPGTPWPATDALDRSLPVFGNEIVQRPRSGRTVGIFYFLWHDTGSEKLPNDLAKILPQDPDLLQKPDSPLWGPKGMYYWGEPLYGYYHPTDPWVLRRHAALLSDAGVDTVIFDTTNRHTYRHVYMKLCAVWAQVRKEGGRTPQVCFMVNTKAGETAQELYEQFYARGHYSELWFHWQGKPLLICDPQAASPEVQAFFTLRAAHWPFTMVNTDRAWHWEATYPQPFGYVDDPTHVEQVNVSVAQNLRISDGKVNNMSDGDSRGRSFHRGKKDPAPDAVNYGHNFAEQFARALELDPPFVMVTGWNEWIAGRHSRPGKPVVFVDQYDQEYSRDIEPVKGLHGDNYYYQLVANVRRYKGAPPLPAPAPATLINTSGAFTQWQSVAASFSDRAFDNDHREFGRGERRYVNTSGRRDLLLAKVAHDDRNLYFYVATRDDMAIPADQGGLWLLLDSDQNPATGWEGYDWAVNFTPGESEAWLHRHASGWSWEKVRRIECSTANRELMATVPRDLLGFASPAPFLVDFKWWDHPGLSGDIMDVYLKGDVAPDARFNYRYSAATAVPTRKE